MSRIPDIGKNHEKLVSVLSEYEKLIDEADEHIRIKGKNLASANVENSTWQLFYNQKSIELGTLTRLLEREVTRVRGSLFRSYKENHSIELNDREIQKYIDNEKAFLDRQELLFEVKEVYEKFRAIVDSFTSRGYALNNLTKIYVGGFEHIEA